MSACGRPPYDIDNETDRKSMIFDIRNDLTAMNCAPALELSRLLFVSKYSDNEIRMLYASAQGCNVGIQLYPLIDSISTSDFSTPNAMFQTLVRLFPSRAALDSKLQSTWNMQDILQASVKDGVVISAIDRNVINAYNIGSVLYRDRTDDANSFLVFGSMAGVGTSLNRYGYNDTDDPAALGYAQAVNLPWITKVLIKGDASHAGCSLASSMLNMFDAIRAVRDFSSGGVQAAFDAILNAETTIDTAGTNRCTTDGYSDGFPGSQCYVGKARLRYRDACFEQDPAASYAAGVIEAINAGWL